MNTIETNVYFIDLIFHLALTERSQKTDVTRRLYCSSMVTKKCLQIYVWSLQMSDLCEHG